MDDTVQTKPRQTSSLAEQLAGNIEQLIIEKVLQIGDFLVERSLAERLKVSRSPVREALKLLAEKGIVGPRPEGGYVVATQPSVAVPGLLPLPELDAYEETYLKIAEDRLSGELPEKATESDLMRRYNLTRTQLTVILQRIGH